MIKFLLLAISLAAPVAGAAPQTEASPKALFYLTREAKSVKSFVTHANKIDIVAPHWYNVDSKGGVTGEPDREVLAAAKANRVAIMPLLTNHGFVQEDVHALLTNPGVHPAMFDAMVRIAREHGYAGWQLDLEHVPSTDRDAMTSLVRAAAKVMHKAGLKLSIATVPNAPLMRSETGYAQWHFDNWGGAFDLKALAESVDLLCLMTYDQHGFTTLPGPVAGYPWVVAQMEHALKVVPRHKLALGIPLYGYHWAAAKPIDGGPRQFDRQNLGAAWIDTADVLKLAKTYNGHLGWDDGDRSAFMYFYRDNVREWVYYTDGRTFDERYKLVKNRGLAAFASWVLGSEDPAVWDRLPVRN